MAGRLSSGGGQSALAVTAAPDFLTPPIFGASLFESFRLIISLHSFFFSSFLFCVCFIAARNYKCGGMAINCVSEQKHQGNGSPPASSHPSLMSLESIRWVRFIVALIVSFVEFAGWGRRPLSG